MKKWLIEFTEKDLSKMPKVVGLAASVLAVLAVAAMVGTTWGIAELGLGEIIPVWVLQLAVMSPWAVFMALIVLAIVACVGLALFDISVHKNFDEYKEAFQFWKNSDSNSELTEEVFGSHN